MVCWVETEMGIEEEEGIERKRKYVWYRGRGSKAKRVLGEPYGTKNARKINEEKRGEWKVTGW